VRALADERALDWAERRARITLHPDQRAAVRGCLSAPLVLLTGGPGVGKTTIVRLVVELAERAGLSVSLASPTGRAAKRLSEATGRPASTIHRLLGWIPDLHRFQHDGEDPLGAELVIVDEISMLDVSLARHLLRAIQPPTRLILVGDPDQLPSVGAGNVLADLLASERLPVFRLTRVFRQADTSLIVENAHRILHGETPRVLGREAPAGDFYLFPAETDELAARRTLEVVTERIPRRFDLDWVADVQVLAPMYRGACGVDALNEGLRAALGASGGELRWKERVWRVGDRVIQTRNDYDKEVFNGDMGRIVAVDTVGLSVRVRFPERELTYEAASLADLAPAFAITVHRSQGGEFPAVVLPLVTQHWPMLQRNLLYTAVTRAKRLVVLVGQARALQRAIANAEPSLRESGLAERLRRIL
jgi:exodeoxyribonuclease V alpha subunit